MDKRAPNFGFRVPDVVANLRVDQAWGFAGISGALHDVSGAYYGHAANNDINGHPADKYGWAVAAGAKFNIGQGGLDTRGFNVCYTQGAPGFCTNQGATRSTINNSVGVGWITDGVFGTGTDIELTRVWSALAFYEHIWNPQWRTCVGWRLRQRRLQRHRHQPDQCLAAGGIRSASAASAGQLAPSPPVTPRIGNSCSPDFSFWETGYAHPVEPGGAARYRPRTDVYAQQHRVQRRGGLCRPTARGRRSSWSTTRTSGPRWCDGSATSIHDRLILDPFSSPRRQTAGGFCYLQT